MKQTERKVATGMPVTSSAYFSGPSSRYQSTECILYGSVFESQKDQLLQRLRGLCHPETGADSPIQVQMRRRFKNDSLYWHCLFVGEMFRLKTRKFLCYIGIPEADLKSPVTVRKTLDSMIFSTDMMVFVKTLGLRMEYEFIADGWLFTTTTKENIRILVYKVEYTEEIGNYSKNNLKPLTESYLVEASVVLPDGLPHDVAAKSLREFADQLLPLCELKKVDYMKD